MEHLNTNLNKTDTVSLIYFFFNNLFPDRFWVFSPLGIWQWFADPVQLLSSSKATGPCVSRPITSLKHSAEHNYGSEYVTASLSRVRTTLCYYKWNRNRVITLLPFLVAIQIQAGVDTDWLASVCKIETKSVICAMLRTDKHAVWDNTPIVCLPTSCLTSRYVSCLASP